LQKHLHFYFLVNKTIGNSFLELGAQYIHGQVDNPIYNISRDHKQIDARYDRIMFAEEGDHNEDNNGICIDLSK